MKKIIIFLILFFNALIAEDILESFINQQVEIETKILNSYLSKKDKEELKKSNKSEYQEFFLTYASNKAKHLQDKDPYKYIINKLKLKLNNNSYRRDKNSILHDELLLKEYLIKKSIRATLKDVLLFTDNRSKAFFEDKVYETIVKHFSKFSPIDTKKINIEELNSSIEKDKILIDSINRYIATQSFSNTFSSELVTNSPNIYRTASLSDSKIISKINQINETPFGKNINLYLININLDLAKVSLLLGVILFTLLVQILVKYIVNRILLYYKLKNNDIKYIQTHITKIFNIITTLFIFHLIFVINLGIDTKSINISKVFAILYVILIALLIYRITNTVFFLKRERMKSSKIVKNEVMNLIIKVINGLIIIVSIIVILKIFGVNLTALLSGLGIAGAAVAFAAKDSIANIFGSISILLGNVFEQGDWIETNDVDGTVVEIGLRASTIRTFDNALISIPNFELANKGVKNWSRRRIGRRIKMNLGVTYESNFKDIKKAIEEIRLMLQHHEGIANEHTSFIDPTREARLVSLEDFKGIKRTTLVYLDEFSDSSINILLYCFSKSVVWAEWLEVKEDIMYKIADILEKNNLEFAYPTMTIHQGGSEVIES